ncbi:MAG: hypothetical protein ACEQR8_09655 [Cypionkella sp.]
MVMLPAALAFAPAAHAQTANEQPVENLPARDDASTDKFQKDAEQDRAFAKSNSAAPRRALEQWAGCVARKNAGEATRVLTMDFTTPTYGRAIRMLAEEDKACMGFRGTMRSAGLLFAGEMAEALLESDSTPLASRLARAASSPATPAFSFTDRVMICAARSAPSEVGALFATTRDSAEENAAVAALTTPMGLCAQAAQARKPLSVSPAGLRAMLATASFRSLASTKAA